MADETIKFEDAKSEELYNWVNEKYSPEKLAMSHYFLVECLGVLKGLKHAGLKYEWIDFRYNTLLVCLKLLSL